MAATLAGTRTPSGAAALNTVYPVISRLHAPRGGKLTGFTTEALELFYHS